MVTADFGTWGVLHPGAMGSSIGAAIRATGPEVLWCPAGRSGATRQRAADDGFTAVDSLSELCDRSDALISVCPPEFASELAHDVVVAGFTGVYIDANAVAPATAIGIAQAVTAAGATAIDGAIIGPPARRPGTTRLYLSGDQADRVAAALGSTLVEAKVISHEIGAASALKVAYAAWTKASAALLLDIRAFAEVEGVSGALLAEWDRSQPGVKDRSEQAAAFVAPKAWRFAGEMRELAKSFEAAGLPRGAFDGAAEVYERLADHKDADGVTIDHIIDGLTGNSQ